MYSVWTANWAHLPPLSTHVGAVSDPSASRRICFAAAATSDFFQNVVKRWSAPCQPLGVTFHRGEKAVGGGGAQLELLGVPVQPCGQVVVAVCLPSVHDTRLAPLQSLPLKPAGQSLG